VLVLVNLIYSVPTDHLEVRPDCLCQLYLTFDDTFNAIIAVVIDCCDLAVDLGASIHPGQERTVRACQKCGNN
jgi:hypothetical protein